MGRDGRHEEPDETPLRLLNRSAGQQGLRRLESACREFFQGKRGDPRFKKGNRFHSVNDKPSDGSRLKGRKLDGQKAGLITGRWHRAWPDGELKHLLLWRKPSGWDVCLPIEVPESEPEPPTGPAVGIDRGLIHALALSDGTTFDRPKPWQQALATRRRWPRKVARRKQGSTRRRKAIKAGGEIVTVTPAYPSQACSGGGCIVPKKRNVRTRNGPDCGLILDRDTNAAHHILSSAGTRRSGANVDGCVMRSPRSSPL